MGAISRGGWGGQPPLQIIIFRGGSPPQPPLKMRAFSGAAEGVSCPYKSISRGRWRPGPALQIVFKIIPVILLIQKELQNISKKIEIFSIVN